MPLPERGTPQPVPVIPSHADGLPWVRLITGLVALALAMLAIPAGRRAPESTARPIPDRVISVEALPGAQPLRRPALRPQEANDPSVDSPAPDAQPKPSTAQARSVAITTPSRRAWRATAPAHAMRRVASSSHRSRGYRRVERPTHALTRAQVEREYMAARDEVAALTREDSGSAWLMRVAAHQRAVHARALLR